MQYYRNWFIIFHRRLCYSCKYAQRIRRKGLYCTYKNEKPFFLLYCPHFSINKTRDQIIHKHIQQQKDLNTIRDILILLSLIISTILIIEAPNLLYLGIISLLILLFVEYHKFFMPKFIREYGIFAYYLLSICETFKNEQSNETITNKFLFQTLIIIYGSKTAEKIIQAKNNNELEIDETKHLKHIKKLNSKQRRLLFLLCTEFSFYGKEKFEFSEKIKNIADYLRINKDEAKILTKKIIDYYNSFKKYQENKKQEKQAHKNYKMTTIAEYFNILGIEQTDDLKKIQKAFYKLSLKYHPDRYNQDTKKQKEAAEKYKKITEAYNFLKKLYS